MEKAYVETMRWLVDHSHKSWTKREIEQGTPHLDTPLNVKKALEQFQKRDLLEVDTSENAYKFRLKSILSEEQRDFCQQVFDGELPEDWKSKQSGRRNGIPKTTLRIMSVLSANMKRAYTIDELAERFKLAHTTVRMPMLRFLDKGLVLSQKSHMAPFITGKAPTYYYLTPEGRQYFRKAYDQSSEHEKRWFQNYVARDTALLEEIGQWVDPKDEPVVDDPSFERMLKHGPLGDDDEIEI